MGLGLDDGDANASLGQGRRDLHPDESGTNENRSLPLGRFGRDGVGVVESAEVVHARQVTAGELETNGPTPGGNEGFLESNGLAVSEDGGLVVEIQPWHGDAENETDVLVVEILLGVEEELVPPLLATQELFGKGRAVIGHVGLLANQRYRAAPVVCAQLLGVLARSTTAADEDLFGGLNQISLPMGGTFRFSWYTLTPVGAGCHWTAHVLTPNYVRSAGAVTSL